MARQDPDLLFQDACRAYSQGRLEKALSLLKRLRDCIGEQAELLHLLALVEASRSRHLQAEKAFARAADLAPRNSAIYEDWARFHCQAGDFRKAEQVLRAAIVRNPNDRALMTSLGELKREADERDDAAFIYDHLLRHLPPDPQTLHARALVELERGGDARAAFERALKAAPEDTNVLIGAAAAFHQAGESDKAIGLLKQAVMSEPAWIEGLRALARLRSECGESENFADDHLEAIRERPREISLWASFLGLLASALRFDLVLKHIGAARSSAGNDPIFDMLEAQALSEIGRTQEAGRLFDSIDPGADASFVPIRLRFLLRTGQIERAAKLGEGFAQSASAPHVWPLIALAWRKLGDPRWHWLERYDETVSVFELPLEQRELGELADLLRRLHRISGQPYDQSARSGTQSMGALLQRTEAPIARLRAALREAVAQYMDRLPSADRRHPFLDRPRRGFRFAGSWSIRLEGGGFHVSHVHPQGWISSACYIALPPSVGDHGATREGWLKLGESPSELGLHLPPVRMIAPQPGRLVLFPSIMWHGTEPFRAGERLTVAFDVVPRGA